MARLPPNEAYFGTDLPASSMAEPAAAPAELPLLPPSSPGVVSPADSAPMTSGLGAGGTNPETISRNIAIVRDMAVRAGVSEEVASTAFDTVDPAPQTTPEMMQVLEAARSVAATDSEVEALAQVETMWGQGQGEFPNDQEPAALPPESPMHFKPDSPY